ncbi:MAG: insulinase family protein [Demequinaceae bacterium]|nr:insulinase family protein [Demequinaceae bacterium]
MPAPLPLVASGDPAARLTLESEEGAVVRRSVLPGGVRVLTEHLPGMRSATVGAWVGVGSRDENDIHAGSTHFLEHLLFKGTKRRTSQDIAEAFDRVGAEHNALTGKEYTCYYARVLDADVGMALDVTLDMVTSARIDEADLELERQVILEELAMNEDDPGDVAEERFTAALFGGHPLGRPIGGTPEIISTVPREAVWEHYRERYTPSELVIAAAGAIDHEQICSLVSNALSQGGWGLDPAAFPVPRRDPLAVVDASFTPRVDVEHDDEQVNLIIGTRGLRVADERRNALAVYLTILGIGPSSRLFQEIREKRGLAYALGAFVAPAAETGVLGLQAGCTPERADLVVDLMAAEFERMADGVSAAELERAQGQITGSTVLRLEDTFSRMSRLARAELFFGEWWTVEEALAEVRAVTADDVAEIAAELAGRERCTVRVGRGLVKSA